LEAAERVAQNYERSGKGNDDDSARRIMMLEEELDEQRQSNNTRVSETPQFIQMRKMMQSQNEKIRDLRY
jgi:hypothetical protein